MHLASFPFGHVSNRRTRARTGRNCVDRRCSPSSFHPSLLSRVSVFSSIHLSLSVQLFLPAILVFRRSTGESVFVYRTPSGTDPRHWICLSALLQLHSRPSLPSATPLLADCESPSRLLSVYERGSIGERADCFDRSRPRASTH